MRHWAEELARDYLTGRGYQLLAENYQVRGGEIDLVMQQGEETVFVEVRQRRNDDFGSAGESLDQRKLVRLRRAARIFLSARFGRDDLPVRLDAVLIHGNARKYRIEHLEAIG